MSNANQNSANRNLSQLQDDSREQINAAETSMNSVPSGFQAIATAYGDYAKRSFEDAKSFVEKLSSVRSVDRAIEVQAEFARKAYETFVEDSQRIAALYNDLAKQTYGGFASKMPPTGF